MDVNLKNKCVYLLTIVYKSVNMLVTRRAKKNKEHLDKKKIKKNTNYSVICMKVGSNYI